MNNTNWTGVPYQQPELFVPGTSQVGNPHISNLVQILEKLADVLLN